MDGKVASSTSRLCAMALGRDPDQLGLEQRVDCEGVVVGVADRSDRRHRAEFMIAVRMLVTGCRRRRAL